MPDLHLSVPPYVVEQINANLRVVNGGRADISIDEIGKEALAVYKWMVEQMAAGRSVGAADETAMLVVQIATPNTPLARYEPPAATDPSGLPPVTRDPGTGPVSAG